MITRTQLTNISHEQAALKAGMLASQAPLFDNLQIGGASMTFERNAEIFGEGESADYVYKVLSGSVRAYKVLSDGRRQVTAFYLPGDVFGIESGSEHSNSAEAIDKATILVVRRSSVFSTAESNSEVARHLWSITAAELEALPESRAAADQDREGADRGISSGHGRAPGRKGLRGAPDVASGHRRLSRPDDRDRIAHADRRCRKDRRSSSWRPAGSC